MTKYIIGEIFNSGGATLYKNPSDQTALIFSSFGRRLSIILFMIILCISSIVTAFSPNMECFIVIRAIIAGSAAAVFTLGYSYSELIKNLIDFFKYSKSSQFAIFGTRNFR